MTTARILVVDDEVEVERLIKQRFRKKIKTKEFEFLFSSNGVEALNRLQSEAAVDMILTDINMPQMGGLSLIEAIASIDETLKAVVVSAYGDIPNIRKAMNLGAFDFLTKPIDFQDLEITIQKTLEFVKTVRDRQLELQRVQSELLHAASHDPLTGLPNRNWFVDRLSQVLAMQKKGIPKSYAILFVDLDRFKTINDSLGHLIGDELLKIVAQRLQSCLRPSDAIARLGGDEFAIVLEDLQNPAFATEIAQRIQAKLRQPFQLNSIEVVTEASIGIALGLEDYQHSEELLRDADIAMYCAKAQGRGRYEVFDPIMQIKIRESLELESHLRQALTNGELCLHYQPIYSTAPHHLLSFEALVRWQHPTRGLMYPAQFIPIAEETGLIISLGWLILEMACSQLRRWQIQFSHRPSPLMNVNISALQLGQADVVRKIETVLEATQLEAKFLKLELTESCLLKNIPEQTKIFKQLRNLGIQLCIDDFGTGYSSLSRLHEFPINTLKIDRSFIKRMDLDSGENIETVKMIVTLAHSLGMDAVAEGVETIAQLEKLKELGCDSFQGYLLSAPVNSLSAELMLLESIPPQS